MNETKTCPKCGETKPVGEFPFGSYRRKDGTRTLYYICKKCKAVQNAIYRRENPIAYKAVQRRSFLKHFHKHKETRFQWKEKNRFKIALQSSIEKARRRGYTPCSATVEEIEAVFTGKCNACELSEERNGKKLCLDHNHFLPGNFRGWLCSACNLSIGHSNNSPEQLIKQAAYLRRVVETI